MSLSLDLPKQYERWNGKDIHPEFPEHLDVPPQWVRERLAIYPNLCEFACLSANNAALFPASVRETLVKYVRSWQSYGAKYGTHLIVAGGPSYQKRNWAAASAINEIVMRFAATSSLSVSWLGIDLIRKLIDARAKKEELYWAVRNNVSSCNLLLITDPLRCATWDERAFLEYVYTRRVDSKLATVTTLVTDVAKHGFGPVKERIGEYSAEILHSYNHGFIAQYQS